MPITRKSPPLQPEASPLARACITQQTLSHSPLTTEHFRPTNTQTTIYHARSTNTTHQLTSTPLASSGNKQNNEAPLLLALTLFLVILAIRCITDSLKEDKRSSVSSTHSIKSIQLTPPLQVINPSRLPQDQMNVLTNRFQHHSLTPNAISSDSQ